MRNIPLSDLTVARSGEHTVISIGDHLRHIGPEVGIFYEKALDLSAQGFNRRQVACIMHISVEEVARLATGNRPYPEIHTMNSTDPQDIDDIDPDVVILNHKMRENDMRDIDFVFGMHTPSPRRRMEDPRTRQASRVSQPKRRESDSSRNIPYQSQDDTAVFVATAALYAVSPSSDSDTCSRPSDTYSSPSPSYDSPSSSGSDSGGSSSCD